MAVGSKKTISIMGVTGSIGQTAQKVILSAKDKFDVHMVSAQMNVQALANAAIALGAKKAVIGDESKLETLRTCLEGSHVQVFAGREALCDLSCEPVDLSLCAIVGMAGLKPLLNAMEGSKAVAIANKEPLVAAGPLVIAQAAKHNCRILPVDSEHNAIFQVFEEQNREQISRIILTASGGPFRTWSLEQMAGASVEQALAHPNWSMGRKISIDSATMMNKALEVIEAHYLFNMPPERIDVLIHPQSVVHSMVEYMDGSILAQLGASDMSTPIAYALGWPNRMASPGQKLDFLKRCTLDFEPPDIKRFPAIYLAYQALSAGQGACLVLNAANEVAVDAFLTKRIGFSAIMKVVAAQIEAFTHKISQEKLTALEEIEEMDQIIRRASQDYIQTRLRAA